MGWETKNEDERDPSGETSKKKVHGNTVKRRGEDGREREREGKRRKCAKDRRRGLF